jgi:O-methyltransferase
LTSYLGVSLETVQANFRRYGLLDDRVKFLPGWFRDTLPVAPVERIAVLRLDGDMYESTHLALTHLYPKLASGGFLIVDDYGALPNCRRAVEDFRHAHAITDSMVSVDWTGMYWRKR